MRSEKNPSRLPIPIEVEGVTYATISEAAKHYDIGRQTVDGRLKLGWSVDKSFTHKVRESKPRLWNQPGFLFKEDGRLKSKPCEKCGEEKSLSAYGINKSEKDGRRRCCRNCGHESTLKSLQESREKYKTGWRGEDGLTMTERKMVKTRKQWEKDWGIVLWLWNQPGCRTHSKRMIAIEMTRRGLWSNPKHLDGKKSYMERMMLHVMTKEGKLSIPPREYLTKHPELPYYIDWQTARKRTHRSKTYLEAWMDGEGYLGSIEHERAVMYLLDGGKSKDFVMKLLCRISNKECMQRALLKNDTSNWANYIWEFTVSASELLRAWPLDDLCPICKTTIMSPEKGKRGKEKKRNNTSLDRKDTEKGYVSGNCGWVCYRCNTRKGNLTLEDVDCIAAWIRSAEKK